VGSGRRTPALLGSQPEDDQTRGDDPALRVLVVDDHPAFRRAVTSALRMVEDVEVVGEAGGGIEGARRAVSSDPDLVLMDLSMPDLDGIETMRRIHRTKPGLPVVILTAHADPGVEKEAREAGASGFLAKGSALEDLVLVLHEATESD
jgi:DNA-binding NarL/FixJ family response regulator